MIIKNNFNARSVDPIKEERESIRNGVKNLDKRFKNREISLENLKKVANNYANEQQRLNEKERKQNFFK